MSSDARAGVGALNRLDPAANLTPAVERWMTFVRQTPQIDGVDIHPHVPDADRISAFVDYILPRMRPEQTFLCTEFSLVWRWQQHLTDPISPDFGSQYEFAPGTQVWQVIGAPTKPPWLLNSVFDPYTVQPDRQGQSGVTSDWLLEFRALQVDHDSLSLSGTRGRTPRFAGRSVSATG